MLQEKREHLVEIYQKWAIELSNVVLLDNHETYSHPYYLHIPDNWFDSKYRLLIVGEEGYGEKQFDTSIADAQAFNRDYLKSQLGLPNPRNFTRSSSAFWRRIRVIARSLEGTPFSMTWTNLDKIHRSGRGNCKLRKSDRVALHTTPIKILSEEINILQPTHVIYFGWYGISLESELPEVYKILYPAGSRDNSMWKGGEINPIKINNVCHVFTYHPNWGQRIKNYKNEIGYEEYVIEKIKETL